MDLVKERIETFINTLKNLMDSIHTLSGSKNYIDNHKITLYLSLIDLMAKVGSDTSGNRERFVDFVSRFCDWQDHNRVSMPQLHYYLQYDSTRVLSSLREYTCSVLKDWPTNQPIPISMDTMYEELKDLWPDSYNGLGRVKKLSYFKHIELLWGQRNSLVHEMRGLGYGWRLFDEREPHYSHCMNTIRHPVTGEPGYNEKTFELYYPIGFYEDLVARGIVNLSEYLHANLIDPYESYRFGSLWIDVNR